LLEHHTPQLLSDEQPLAMALLDVDFMNVRAAWQWAITRREYAMLVEAIPAFFQFSTIRSYIPECSLLFEEFTALLRAAVTRPEGSRHRHYLGYVLMNLGALYADLQDADRAIPLLEESLSCIDETRAPLARAWGLARLGYARTLRGDLPEAEQLLAESIACSQECESIQLYVLHRLSNLEQTRGNVQQSCRLGREALAIARVMERANRIAHVLIDLAGSELFVDDYDSAATHLQEALTIWRELGNRHGEAQALHGLGKVAWLGKENRAEARTRFGEALALYRGIGHEAGSRDCLADLARLDGERVAVAASASASP
jgi:tetratricopeptide (TPR) repeat protein